MTRSKSLRMFATVCMFAAACALAQSQSATPRLVTLPIDDSKVVTLAGFIHPAATADNDRGPVEDSAPVGHIVLMLRRSERQQHDLDALVDQLHNTRSEQFHKWLTPAELGRRFGPADKDVAAVAAWLRRKGFIVEDAPPSKTHITFTGTAGQMRDAFHADIHRLSVNGEEHQATVTEPEIPLALAPVVAGFRQLHNFEPTPGVTNAGVFSKNLKTGVTTRVDRPAAGAEPDLTGNFNGQNFYEIGPQDFYTIYNETPLLSSGITGAGVTIAVIERSQIVAADVATFRSAFGLAAYPATPSSTEGGVNYIYGSASGVGGDAACTAPLATGAGNGDQTEASLDVEWAGAVAPKAIVDFVSCGKKGTGVGSSGVDLAAEHIANYLAGTVTAASLSYGECESQLGSAGVVYMSNLWEQFAAEGITAVVSSGDSGPDRCDQGDRAAGSAPSVNGLASSVYNVSAGGTDFADAYISNQYATTPASTWWDATNGPGNSSARSYIQEKAWGGHCSDPFYVSWLEFNRNVDYGATYTPEGICFGAAEAEQYNLISVSGGGGGVSTFNTIPTWQSVYGVGKYSGSTTFRNMPDIALFAASGFWGHLLEFCDSDRAACSYSNATDGFQTSGAGGTSFVAPQVAGLMALVNQATGDRQGQADYTLYNLAAQEYGTPAKPNDAGISECSGSARGADVASTCVFHDIAGDTHSLQGGFIASATLEPCYTFAPDCHVASASDSFGISSIPGAASSTLAYYAGAGYDLTTGLGSVNIDNLVRNWRSVSPTFVTSTALNASSTSLSGTAKVTLTAVVTATGRGGTVAPAGVVGFYVGSPSGTPVGKASIVPSCTGSGAGTVCKGAAALSVTGAELPAGNSSVIAYFEGDGANDGPSTSPAVSISNSNKAQAIHIEGLPATTTYGSAGPYTLAATGGASGNPIVFSLVSGPAAISAGKLTIRGAGTVVVAANQAGNATYAAATQATQSIAVAKAVLTVTPNNVTRYVRQPNPAFTSNFKGFVNGDTAATAVTGTPSYTTTATAASLPGVYILTATQGTLAALSYTFKFEPGTLTVTSKGTTAKPIVTPPSGVYSAAQNVTITDSSPGAVIYYTKDGSTPTTSSTQYTGAIHLTSSATIKAIAAEPDYLVSSLAESIITIN